MAFCKLDLFAFSLILFFAGTFFLFILSQNNFENEWTNFISKVKLTAELKYVVFDDQQGCFIDERKNQFPIHLLVDPYQVQPVFQLNKLIKNEIFKISHEDYPVIFKKRLGNDILNNNNFIKIINFRNKIAKKINLPKNWVFSDKEIIKNIKNTEVSIISKNLKNIEIKKLTKLIKKFKKTFNKVS